MVFIKMLFCTTKNIVLCFLLLLFGCNADKQKEIPSLLIKINITTVNFEIINGLANVNNHPFSGLIYVLYPNSLDTAEVREYLNGNENGEWRKYYAEGKLREKRSFLNGQKTGAYLVWWPNGKQQQIYNFANDVYEGICREWTEDGILIKEMSYSKGYEIGGQKAWWDNGKIKSNYIIKDGRRYGLLGTKNCINVSDSIFK